MSTLTSTWDHGDPPPETIATDRLLGPPPWTDGEFFAAHFHAVWLSWQPPSGAPPDDGTDLETSWTGFLTPIVTTYHANAISLRAFLDAHIALCKAAGPLP